MTLIRPSKNPLLLGSRLSGSDSRAAATFDSQKSKQCFKNFEEIWLAASNIDSLQQHQLTWL